jgi:hypothetical protein
MYLLLKSFVILSISLALAYLPGKVGERTNNPQKFVLSHARSPKQGITLFDCAKCTAMSDFLFISPTQECGNAGCPYFLFKKNGNKFEYVTTIFIAAGGFQFLKSQHHGLNDILSYGHMSAFEGTLVREEFDGKKYRQVGPVETIKSEDFKTKITPEPVKREYLSKDLKPTCETCGP